MAEGEPALDGPVEAKIAWARTCFDREKTRLLVNPPLVRLLESLGSAIRQSSEHRVLSGIVDCCRECEEKQGGSCCGEGLEKYYSGTLLLVNLLLGVTLPQKREVRSSCFFLSSSGCCLLARHVVCINYVCEKILSKVKPDQLAALREAEGEETLLLFHVNETLKTLLRRPLTAEQAGNAET